MSGKSVLLAQAMDDDFVSAPQSVQISSIFSIQCVFLGTTVAGTLSLECSTDIVAGIAENWDLVPDSSQVLSASGSTTYNLSDQGYPFVRVKWVDSGSHADSVMSVTSNVKG